MTHEGDTSQMKSSQMRSSQMRSSNMTLEKTKRVLAVSVTRSGSKLCSRLPYEHVHGDAAKTVQSNWRNFDAFVLVIATGAAVRIVAPLLESKETDPAIVCVDEAGRFAIALVGGHRAGANELAQEVAAFVGAQPVVTTASEIGGIVALDSAPGFPASGDVATVNRAILDGDPIEIDNRLNWPLPSGWVAGAGGPGLGPLVIVSDEVLSDTIAQASPSSRPVVVVRPPSLVLGVGTSTDAPTEEVGTLVAEALHSAGLAAESVAEVATIDRRATEPAILALGMPVRTYEAAQLAAVDVPTPSAVVAEAVGTPSVAEAAALLAAGSSGVLLSPKHASRHATVAIARRAGPRGSVTLVGLGPGSPDHRTPAAARAVRNSDVVIGYSAYTDMAHDLITGHQQVITSELGAEIDRARVALNLAASGRRVALVCSGDAGIYAMASPLLELCAEPEFSEVDVEVVPGVTAALAAAALLGAPLGHDFATVSLSDLLTPWETIESRLVAAAGADMSVVIYNPRSKKRDWQLERALEIFLAYRAPSTPVGVVTDAGRPSESVIRTTIGDLDVRAVTMTSCVIVGSSTTVISAGRIVTPRGYKK